MAGHVQASNDQLWPAMASHGQPWAAMAGNGVRSCFRIWAEFFLVNFSGLKHQDTESYGRRSQTCPVIAVMAGQG